MTKPIFNKMTNKHTNTPKKKKAHIGRPSIISDGLTTEICNRIEAGESLRKICLSDHMPTPECIRKWLVKGDMGDEKYKFFVGQYARAREAQADTLADEITEIADTEPDPNRARVRVDARKWIASKLKPKRYGDRIDVEVSPQPAVVDISFTTPELTQARIDHLEAENRRLRAIVGPQDVELLPAETGDNDAQ